MDPPPRAPRHRQHQQNHLALPFLLPGHPPTVVFLTNKKRRVKFTQRKLDALDALGMYLII